MQAIKFFIDTFVYYLWGDYQTITRIFKDFERFDETHAIRIFYVCNEFIRKFVTEENNEFTMESFNVTMLSDMKRLIGNLSDTKKLDISNLTATDAAIYLIKYVIDSGYYISITGEGHVMTIVNYDIREDGKFVLIIKNSYGKNRYRSSITNTFAENGIFKMTIDEVIERKLTHLSFIFPKHATEEDKKRIEAKNEEQRKKLDEIDRIYRMEHKTRRSKAGSKTKSTYKKTKSTYKKTKSTYKKTSRSVRIFRKNQQKNIYIKKKKINTKP